MNYLKILNIVFVSLFFLPGVHAGDFVIVNNAVKATIVYAPGEAAIDSITANLLADDILRVTGYRPLVSTDLTHVNGNVILIGSIQSAVIRNLLGNEGNEYKSLNGEWERYLLKVIHQPYKNIGEMLLITGSDRRGTAYGVFEISEKIGVSPWYWWADVHPLKKKELVISQENFISSPPSVKYRGIFINDEDWGLQPWAAKTFEPETGDIGPKTYAKVFELLLRLKANLIWPAMHPSTKAFYFYPGNKKVAEDYAIVIGSSHAEPMLRNNVDEWNIDKRGPFNYITNKENVYKYWEDRVKESSTNEVVYTLGMRGVHDSGIEGVKSPAEAVPLLERIIADQRDLLTRYVNPDPAKIAQAFTVYKEVLDIYDLGLKLPDDAMIVWPDDNYGYIQRLNDQKENNRPGGSGVYYHASYWGRPHDYLWLSSTHPALIREEMMKARETGSNKLWVLNVGDIKPLEYNIQLFMDMAWQAEPFKNSTYTKEHLLNWANKIFGPAYGKSITGILWEYYQLAFERRPEFMGWSQTEPTTQTTHTAYNHFYFGDEAQRRIDRYDSLETKVKLLKAKMNVSTMDAFYELVYYPVTGASLMNKKFLYRDKSILYAGQNRSSAPDYAIMAKEAYNNIVKETNYYNDQLAGGKWKWIMSMAPRKLPVFDDPAIPGLNVKGSGTFDIAPEGFISRDSSFSLADKNDFELPVFNSLNNQQYFVDIFLTNNLPVNWSSSVSDAWIHLSQQRGSLIPVLGKKQVRIWVSINPGEAPDKDKLTGQFTIKGAGRAIEVEVIASNPRIKELNTYKGFVEINGYLSIFASNYSRNIARQSAQWNVWNDIGHTGKLLVSSIQPLEKSGNPNDPGVIKENAPHVEYDFYTFTAARPLLNFFSLPTQPLNNTYSMRFAAAIDDGPAQIIDFKTTGRSEIWKQNVLRNSAQSIWKAPLLDKGKHTLKIYMIDPGVLLERVTIDMGGLPKAYSVIPETRISRYDK